MSERDLESLLSETMRDVLEMSFFAEILDERMPEAQAVGQPSMAARIEFSGAASGSFMLVADALAVHMLADEFMGGSVDGVDVETADANGEEKQRDVADEEVFRELTNILCGSLLSRFQADRCCSLSQPTLCSEEMADDWKEAAGSTKISSGVLLESGAVTGYWKLDGVR